MRYLIFDTQDAAQAAVDLIDSRGRGCYRMAGYSIRDDGAIIGQRDGKDDAGGVTATWDVPQQRLDGKWIVAHPEAQPMAMYEMQPGVTVLSIVMDGIDAPTDEWLPDWWPQREP